MRAKFYLSGAAAAIVLLTGCGTSAPLAPIGLNKHPANSPATVSELTTPANNESVRTDIPASTSVSAPMAIAKVEVALPQLTAITVSDYDAPGGLASLPHGLQNQMLLSAERSSQVVVRARTDFTSSSPRAKAAAIQRGADAKRYLIRQGIPAAKIRLYYRSAGGFVDNNNTTTGRAKNRRVEIQFL